MDDKARKELKEAQKIRSKKIAMTIDRSKRILIDRFIDTYVVCGGGILSNYNPTINITREDYEAFKVAVGIMCKYQEIQEIVTEWQKQKDPKIKFVASNCNMTKIAEVLDGNDKKTKSSDEP